MKFELKKPGFSSEKTSFFRFKKLGGKFLITNDIGGYAFLEPAEFEKYLAGKTKKGSKIHKELKRKGFLEKNRKKLVQKYRQRNLFLFAGPSLHIFVPTLRCGCNCVYCQASSKGMKEKGFDMSFAVAEKAVRTALSCTSPNVTLEFQGGEPLANWKTVKHIIEYAERENKEKKKKLSFSLVTNFCPMDEEKYGFLKKHGISFCTSLDGPEYLHNKNRPCPGKNSHKEAVKWIKRIGPGRKMHALATVSRHSLKYPKEIVEEYRKLGFKGVHLRPLSYLGFSGKRKTSIGYSPEEFLGFWKKAMDHILKINLKGEIFFERQAQIMLKKILTDKDPGYLELRSPCGAGTGQLLYNYDGGVYTCDEGRMTGDETFKIGNLKKDGYREIVSHPTVKAVCIASLLENLPCDYCPYKPYCGVCPVQNYALEGQLFPQMANCGSCKIKKGMLDYIFLKLENKRTERIFRKWASL